MRKRRWIPFVAILASFIFLELASLHFMQSSSQLQKAGITARVHTFTGRVWDFATDIRSYFSLKKENERLSEENLQLLSAITKMEEAARNNRLDTMKVSLSGRGFTFINAEVVKMSRNKQHNYFIINRGYEDGISPKSGVITKDGVAGVIDAVSARHSYASSFQNADIYISARLGREGAVGPLTWDGIHSDRAVLREIPIQLGYHPGDTVYTSGFSLMFPPDIPLGIAGEAKVANGSTNEIQVLLFQDYSTLRYVTVVHNKASEEIDAF